jgi:hypothetical protein
LDGEVLQASQNRRNVLMPLPVESAQIGLHSAVDILAPDEFISSKYRTTH